MSLRDRVQRHLERKNVEAEEKKLDGIIRKNKIKIKPFDDALSTVEITGLLTEIKVEESSWKDAEIVFLPSGLKDFNEFSEIKLCRVIDESGDQLRSGAMDKIYYLGIGVEWGKENELMFYGFCEFYSKKSHRQAENRKEICLISDGGASQKVEDFILDKMLDLKENDLYFK